MLAEKKCWKKNVRIFLAYNTPQPPLSVYKKFQPNRSIRLVGYTQHRYECLILLYRYLNLACQGFFLLYPINVKRSKWYMRAPFFRRASYSEEMVYKEIKKRICNRLLLLLLFNNVRIFLRLENPYNRNWCFY